MNINKVWNRMYTILFITTMILNISFYMISTTLSKHLVEQGVTIVVTGTIIGAMPMAAMLIRPFSGWISDHFRKKELLIIFLSLNGLCVAGYGLTDNEAFYIALRIIHGVSFGMTTTVIMALVASYIPQGRLGEGLGYFGLAQTIAMAIGPSIGLSIGQLASSKAMFFAAALCIGLSLVFLPLLQEENGQAKGGRNGRIQLRLSDFIAKEAILFAIISYGLASANGIEASYIALYGESLGYANVGWYFTISAIALFAARVLCGKLVDRQGFSFVFYPSIILVIVAMVVLSYAEASNVIIAFSSAAIVKAIGVGALQPALQAMVVQRATSERRGAATSTLFVGTDLGQAISPGMAGRMIDDSGYSYMFRMYTLPLIIVLILYAIAAWWGKQRKRSRGIKKTY